MGSWERWSAPNPKFSDLVGKTFASIVGKIGDEEIVFTTVDGEKYRLVYHHDCCAGCSIEDICGDLADLIGSPILQAEDVHSNDPDESVIAERKAKYAKALAEFKPSYAGDELYWYGPEASNDWKEESETWCFYKLATVKGSVTIRWYGSSNGYYSESATFEKWDENGEE